MKALLVLLILIFPFFSFSQEKKVETKEVNVAIGIDKILEIGFDFNPDLNIGDRSLMTIKPDLKRKQLVLIGKKQGNTSLTLKDQTGEEKIRYIVSVTANDQSKVVQELRELLNDVEGLKIGIKGGKVFVGGYIVVPSDIGKVGAVLINYPEVLRLVEMHPQTQQIIAKKMTEELARFNFKNVSVRVVNNAFWVEGVVGSEGEKKVVESITIAYLPDKVEKLAASSDRVVGAQQQSDILFFLSVNQEKAAEPDPLKKLVKISAQFVELSKDYSKIFGFKWSPLMSDGGASVNIGRTSDGNVTSNTSNTFSAVISNLFPRIQSLKNAGYGRILQSGVVVAQEETQATINKTTTTPFNAGSGENTIARDQKIKFDLAVVPKIKQDDVIELNPLNVVVSLPSGTNADGLPITTENNVKTILTVKSGQSAVVGGVVQSQDITGYDKNDPAPLTNDQAPNVLFRFLRSKSHNISKNQYVVFVTPEIIKSASADTAEVRRKFRRRR